MKPTIIAHKAHVHPEQKPYQTENIQKIFELGADGIELDVHTTLDNKVVVKHSSLLKNGELLEKRPAEGTELLDAMLQKQIIPAGKKLLLDIKSPGFSVVDELCKLVAVYNLTDCEIFSSDSAQIYYLSLTYPAIHRGLYIRGTFFESWMTQQYLGYVFTEQARSLKLHVLHLPHTHITKELVAKLQKHGITVHANIPTVATIARIYSLGCNQISTDCLPETLQFISKHP